MSYFFGMELPENFAIKSTSNKKDPRAYRIRFNAKGNGAGFSAKTFIDHIGIDYSERRSIVVDVNPNSEYLLEVQVPENFFKRKLSSPRIVEKGKTA